MSQKTISLAIHWWNIQHKLLFGVNSNEYCQRLWLRAGKIRLPIEYSKNVRNFVILHYLWFEWVKCSNWEYYNLDGHLSIKLDVIWQFIDFLHFSHSLSSSVQSMCRWKTRLHLFLIRCKLTFQLFEALGTKKDHNVQHSIKSMNTMAVDKSLWHLKFYQHFHYVTTKIHSKGRRSSQTHIHIFITIEFPFYRCRSTGN